MSEARERFADASALFALFTRSSWKSCHLRTGSLEIFVSRDVGIPNPIIGVASSPVEAAGDTLRAPHLGTLVTLADVGTRLAAGDTYARLELLGETIDLIAETGGLVGEHLQPRGVLVEYDQPLLSLS